MPCQRSTVTEPSSHRRFMIAGTASGSFGLLFWVPLQQGRKEGIEIKLIRSSYWPCVWDVVKEFGPTADHRNLAHFPEREPPRPCDSYKPL